ncbi:hypothetical protein [Hyphobacterium sp.]|uniref:hypothetical protein n=1 Tax=Hyphobacterium sp. TaxID=2004662 RepID=UPI003BADB121
MMFRIGLLCLFLTGLSACVATPSGTNLMADQTTLLPASQQSLRAEAAALDARFHEAGWVAEEHGAAVQRLTGMLMFGRGNAPELSAIDIYYRDAGLAEASADQRLVRARLDLAEAASLVDELALETQGVLSDPAVTAATLTDDLAALDYAIGDARQALSLFHSVNEQNRSEGDDITSAIGQFRTAFQGLSAAADALADHRRELRGAPGS